MARQARIVIPDCPHHVTQRGNRGEPVFFGKDDFKAYIDILSEQCKSCGVTVVSYCILPNQIHLIAIPRSEDALARAIGEAHRRYTRMINERNGWRGHLFQDRFFSYVMDKRSMLRAARFIETLPVTAGIAPKPDAYLWSSAKGHIRVNAGDPLVKDASLTTMVPDWEDFLARPMDPDELKAVQLHLQTGRPRGSDEFLDSVESEVGRPVRPQKRGRKPKQAANG